MLQRRFSRESQQEQISRRQIAERFLEFGWIPSEPSLDLGEDFLVHIYIEGRATGVTFHVQAKSTSNLPSLRKGSYLGYYPIKPKDLKHWELFSVPVVLIIWDTTRREGRWELISDVIAELDKRRPQWRNNTRGVSVRIPWGNTLADRELLRLKARIGRHFYPQISSGKVLEGTFAFSFPNSLEGEKAYQDFKRFLERGESVILKGDAIQGVRFSEWWEQWFGKRECKDGTELHMGAVTSSPIPATLNIIGTNGESASIPHIEFKVIQAGTEYVRLSNEHQASPLRFTLGICRQKPELSIAARGFGNSLEETRNVLRFLSAISGGGRLCVMFSGLEDKPLIVSVDPQPSAAPDPPIVEIIDNLTKIQNRTGIFVRIPDQGISPTDIRAINELCEIMELGCTTEIIPSASLELNSKALKLMLNVHRQGKPISLRITSPDSFVELFWVKIPTGPRTRSIKGFIEMSVAALEREIAELAVDQSLPINLVRVTVTDTFPAYGR